MKIKKKNHHLPPLPQNQVYLKAKNMTVAAATAALSVTAKISGRHPKMKYSVAVVLYLWEFGLLVFSLYLSQFS